MKVLTKIVLLMHPKEARHERCGTGRLSCLHIAEAEIITDVDFDNDPRVSRLIGDPENYPVLLYPGRDSIDLSSPQGVALLSSEVKGRRIVAFLVDATWSCSRTVLKHNPRLMTLPKLMFTPKVLSRWLIKRQPGPLCLSTIETVHELLCALEDVGLERYPDKSRLLKAFESMQEYHIARAEANGIPRYKQKTTT
jgi:DTW domain-containing protein YfiP